MYDSILVPVDGSDPANDAATEAIALAETFDATLSLLHVLEPTWFRPEAAMPENPDRDVVDDLTEQALARAQSRAAEHGVDCRAYVEHGVVHREIESHVEDHGVDLVAMGTHGRTGLERVLLGSVTERVLQTCPTPVMTTGDESPQLETDNILVPTDGSDSAERATEHALTLAEHLDATVHALSVVNARTTGATFESGEALARVREQLRRARHENVETVAERADDCGVPCETTVIEGAPEEVILSYVDDHDIDLVTMGTRGESGLGRGFFGSVTERTVRRSDAPVVSVPADGQ